MTSSTVVTTGPWGPMSRAGKRAWSSSVSWGGTRNGGRVGMSAGFSSPRTWCALNENDVMAASQRWCRAEPLEPIGF